MSTPPETPSPRSLAREAAGLLLVVAGVLVTLVALRAVHPVLSTSVAAASTFAVFRFWAPPRSRVSRLSAYAISVIVAAAAVGCAFAYFPPMGWVEVGAGISAMGVWLASEGA
ncbi:hypothetical protein [Streptomyces cavernicola]|uniref:Uncharacterized protein n=1 Tax=Streptomyces cavernicola TaxID=3043613 RepID=A0ABT6SIF3_9ACTN|nr:hypothetical protein [Streptomyces sp. B-S-A6]MDI3407664.1 hypothetical protein [Streptomyces sp. B-S-A6]